MLASLLRIILLTATLKILERGLDKGPIIDEEEFYKLLYMPEAMIIYRLYFEKLGMTSRWWEDFKTLTESEKQIAKPIIEKNIFTNIESLTDNNNVLHVLQYYQISRKSVEEKIKQL